MNLTKMKQELLRQVNQESQVDIEKVERYVALAKMFQKLQREANKKPMVVTKNGAQEFTKANPALADMNKINSSLIALGRDMGLTAPPAEAKKAGYSASDLV